MEPSRKGLLFIAAREWIVTTAYQDGAHMSIGFGDNDPSLKPGDSISVPEVFARFKRAIPHRVEQVNKALKVPVLQHEFDALFSGYYQSGTDLLRDVSDAINDRDRRAVAAAFFKHDTNAAGVSMDGLLKRRSREACLYLTGEYGELVVRIFRGDPKKVPSEPYDIQPEDL